MKKHNKRENQETKEYRKKERREERKIRSQVRKAVGRNNRTLLGFELIYKLLSLVVLLPAFYGLFALSMRISGYRYLTAENVLRFLRHPVFLAAVLVFLLVAGILTTFDGSAVIYILDQSFHEQDTDVRRAVRFSWRSLGRFWKRKNFGITVLQIPVLLLYSIPMLPVMLSRMSLPGFLIRKVGQHVGILAVLALIAAVLVRIFLRHRYALHFMLLGNCPQKEASEKSRQLSEGNQIGDLLRMILFDILIALALIGVVLLEVLVLAAGNRLFRGKFWGIPESVVLILCSVSLLVFFAAGAPLGYMQLSTLFYRHMREKNRKIVSLPARASMQEAMRMKTACSKAHRAEAMREQRRRVHGTEVLLVGVSLVLASFYVYSSNRGVFNPKIEYLHTVEITAHRGASRYYPENTMAAFEGAVEQGADWIELDIHLSKDGQIFVMHDPSFRRTAGVRAYAWEKTADEIREMDAGSFFSRQFAGEPIPFLEDVIRFAKEKNVRLNIEIKPSPQEEGLEKKLSELLEETGFVNQCVVTSQSYASLKKIRKLNPDISTVYVMSYAYGRISRMKSSDNFSVRSTSITSDLVTNIHNSGKQIYAWTVNDRYRMDQMIERNVDNLITDNVPLAKKQVESHRQGDLLTEYVSLLNDLL